jgi:hypothetical protein
MIRDTKIDTEKKLVAPPSFPGPRPKPHDTKKYLDSMVECFALNGLADVAAGNLPSRVAHLTKYPDNMVVEPDKPKRDATEVEKAAYDKRCSIVFDRKRENEQIDLKIAVAIRDDRSSVFSLLTDSMKITNPGLRDALRLKFTRRHSCATASLSSACPLTVRVSPARPPV